MVATLPPNDTPTVPRPHIFAVIFERPGDAQGTGLCVKAITIDQAIAAARFIARRALGPQTGLWAIVNAIRCDDAAIALATQRAPILAALVNSLGDNVLFLGQPQSTPGVEFRIRFDAQGELHEAN